MAPRIADCPLGRAIALIGSWWVLELLHEAFDGRSRLDEVCRNLDLPPQVVRERIDDLVQRGLLIVRDDRVVPTDLAHRVRPVLLILAALGNAGLAPAERGLVLVDRATGAEVEPVVVDRRTGRRVDTEGFTFAAGPAASVTLRARYPAGA
ncbi:winged helix-turn-helix transcriptional regulator [Saccharothrix syringae]|uniref:Transcriptional regulator n=1 Tax=Saccharothrix syringae TaxID=103733 RepID=A0A5Q0H3B5_SACSY|nr:helix-turn-helix transcriptional regulator [Saccharothrix syringae]QFZ20405.1 transcriptional regulator [Saccharothrix syringae]